MVRGAPGDRRLNGIWYFGKLRAPGLIVSRGAKTDDNYEKCTNVLLLHGD